MALDFDVDEGPSFAELVQSGRSDVMKGRSMSQCWSELADQHTFFKDIAKEGRLRGETLGSVLAAVEGICRVVSRTEAMAAVTAAEPSASGCPPADAVTGSSDAHDAEVLARVADAYVCLYGSTPVPTRAQWVAAMASALSHTVPSAATAAAAAATETHQAVQPCESSPSSSGSTQGKYVAKLRTSVAAVAQEVSEGEGGGGEGEDGSFAEEVLKDLMRCCMACGRRAARSAKLSKEDARVVREMVKALQDFVGSSTLEW